MGLIFQAFLGSGKVQPPQEVVNPFSDLVSFHVYDFAAYNHNVMVGDRQYMLWRESFSHNAYDGKLWMAYSDNDGETWTVYGEFYDPIHVLTDNPSYLISDPLAETDTRDSIMLLAPNGAYLVVVSPVAIGHQEVDLSRNTLTHRSVSIRIPIINGNELDYANKTTTYITDGSESVFVSSTLFNDGNTMYAASSSGVGNRLHKSLDNGVTWSLVAKCFNRLSDGGGDDYAGSEVSINVVDGNFIGIARNLSGGYVNHIFGKSADNGLTWNYNWTTNESVGVVASIHAPDLKPLDNGRFVVVGRENIDDSNDDRNVLKVFNSADWSMESKLYLREKTGKSGYGSILKYRDKWFASYFSNQSGGFGMFFRQLDENNYTFSFGTNLIKGVELLLSDLTYGNITSNSIDLACELTTYNDAQNVGWYFYIDGIYSGQSAAANLNMTKTLTGLNSGQNYNIYVIAKILDGTEFQSNIINITTL